MSVDRTLVSASLALCALAACAPNAYVPQSAGLTAPLARAAGLHNPLEHIIVVVQEGRTFENLFAGYPGANAPMTGRTFAGATVPLAPIALNQGAACAIESGSGLNYGYFNIAYDNGAMNGFSLLDPAKPLCPYTYVERDQTAPYWKLAKEFALSDRMFASTIYGNFTNELYLIAGTAKVGENEYALGTTEQPAGCDAPNGTATIVVGSRGVSARGPFPCYTQFHTMADLLDSAGVSWKYYVGAPQSTSAAWNAFSAIEAVRFGADWSRDMSSPATNVFADLKNGNLPAVSWVVSNLDDSDLAQSQSAGGPQWVWSLVNAARRSAYWSHMAIIVVWSDAGAGQFYDNVAPPHLTPIVNPGFRVPMLVVSPYARHGYVSHTQYEFGSILRFIGATFALSPIPPLNPPATENSIADCFRF